MFIIAKAVNINPREPNIFMNKSVVSFDAQTGPAHARNKRQAIQGMINSRTIALTIGSLFFSMSEPPLRRCIVGSERKRA